MVKSLQLVDRELSLDELENLMDMVLELIQLNHRAFTSYKKSYLADAERVAKRFDLMAKSMIECNLVKKTGDTVINKIYAIAGMKEEQVKLYELIKEKNRDGILFSDKGLGEINELFDILKELTIHTRDYLATGNYILHKHINEMILHGHQKAKNYSTEHEERLIKGICMPQSSDIYLQMMEKIKTHFKQFNMLI